MSKILTIGMAVYDDYAGLRSTIQAIRINNADVMHRVQFVVVDNHPNEKFTMPGAKLAKKVAEGCLYISMASPHGTCPPRQRVFEVASTPWVMCMDSHVHLLPRAIPALLEYIDAHPDSNDLISGPLVLDDLKTRHTHLNNVWRSQWQGTWAYDSRAEGTEPFEIEAQGLWLFAARREQWLNVGGFNPNFQGFGGGEFYIHEKFRRAGGKCLCLPELQGIHQFDFPDGKKFPNNYYERARNKIIGHTELGWPLDDIYRQFAIAGKLSESEWKLLTANPSNPPERSPTLGLILPRTGSGERPTVITERQPPVGGKMGRKKPEDRPVSDLTCSHRLQILREQPCDLCGLEKGIPQQVYGCSLHGECTLNKKIRTIRGCAACGDRTSAPPMSAKHVHATVTDSPEHPA